MRLRARNRSARSRTASWAVGVGTTSSAGTLTNSLSLIGPRRSNSSRLCRQRTSNRSTCSTVYRSCCTATASCISTATLLQPPCSRFPALAQFHPVPGYGSCCAAPSRHRPLQDLKLRLDSRVVPINAKVHHPREHPVVVLVKHTLPGVKQRFQGVVRVPPHPRRPVEPEPHDDLAPCRHKLPPGTYGRRLCRQPHAVHPRLRVAGDHVHGAAAVRKPPVHVVDAGRDAGQHYPQYHHRPTPSL